MVPISFVFLCWFAFSVQLIRADFFFQKNFAPVYEWKRLEFGYANQSYFTKNAIPNDLAVEYRADSTTRTFLTISRYWSDGVPYTLGIVSNRTSNNGPVLLPYPKSAWHNGKSAHKCDIVKSAVRIAIDECKRLWVVDSGIVEHVQICPPKILAIDLRADKVVHRYHIPSSQFVSGASALGAITVDAQTCRATMVYVADVSGSSLIVYDMASRRSWRVQNKLMYPDPDFGTIEVSGEKFEMMAGIFAMSLTPKNANEKRYLYFHSLSSDTENRVPLSIVNNRTIWVDRANRVPEEFEIVGRRGVQCAAEAMDSRGRQYCGLTGPEALVSWDTRVTYRKRNLKIISFDRERFQFVSGLKVVRTAFGTEELWGLSTRVQKFVRGTVDWQDVNFRIFGCGIDQDMYDGSVECRLARKGDEHVEYNNIFLG